MTTRRQSTGKAGRGEQIKRLGGASSADRPVKGVDALPMGAGFTVRRTRLLDEVLTYDASGKAIVVCAPDNFGKTALVLQIVDEVRTDPKRGAALLIDAHDAQVDELLMQFDDAEGLFEQSDHPLVAIDGLPRFEKKQARMIAARLRELRSRGCGIVVACGPSNQAFLKAFGDSVKITPRALLVGPHEYSDWARAFSLPIDLDIYRLTQGVPALVAGLRGTKAGAQELPRQFNACVFDVYQAVLKDLAGWNKQLLGMASLMMLLGNGSLADMGRCGPGLSTQQVSAFMHDYPVFGVDPALQTFACVDGAPEAMRRLCASIVRDEPRLARRAVKTLVKLGRIDRATALVARLLEPDEALKTVLAFPTDFSLAGHAQLVMRLLAVPRDRHEPARPRELTALYVASIMTGDLRSARSAASRLSRLAEDIEAEVDRLDWQRAEAVNAAWGGSDGLGLPSLPGDAAEERDAASDLLLLHAQLLRAVVRHEDLPDVIPAERAQPAGVELDLPRLLVAADRLLGEAMLGVTLRLDDRDDKMEKSLEGLAAGELSWVGAQVRLAVEVRRLLLGIPVTDKQAFADVGTVFVRATNQEMQLFCLVLEGWQSLLDGEVANAGFRGRQVARLAGEDLQFLFDWAKLLEQVAYLRNTSRVTVREEAALLDLQQQSVTPLYAWRVALTLAAARMDAELSAWYSLQRPALMEPSVRLLARLALDALGDRSDAMRRLIPHGLLSSYSNLAPAGVRNDSLFQLVERPPADDDQVEIRLFGGFRAERGGHIMLDDLWRRKKTSILAARLVLAEGSFVRRDVLAAEFWPQLSEERGRCNLYTALSALRHALGQRKEGVSYLITQGDGIAINTEYISSDVMVFNALARQVLLRRTGVSAPQLIELCLKIEEVYCGPLYVPDRDAPAFFRNMRKVMQSKFIDCMMRGVDLAIDEQNVTAAIWMAESALRHDPGREDVVRAAMRVYDMDGRRREVEELYKRHGLYLSEHGDGLPEPETRALYERIMQRLSRRSSAS
ncbi:BTAD domain-containing putative transcriptional regulator [Collinsella sp. An2]|uniref:BTAD domain-containing putative transcriptional regulator n=1 Tax=Collinsella sp. An2 TaxID=1965585 RepID=UPI0013025952|nr:BTAD domain-containing putative transcriptional regulator [Collinsella sp. An2]